MKEASMEQMRNPSPMAIIAARIAAYRRVYPTHLTEINAFVDGYRLPDGSLRNDGDIIPGLKRIAKHWKRSRGRGCMAWQALNKSGYRVCRAGARPIASACERLENDNPRQPT